MKVRSIESSKEDFASMYGLLLRKQDEPGIVPEELIGDWLKKISSENSQTRAQLKEIIKFLRETSPEDFERSSVRKL